MTRDKLILELRVKFNCPTEATLMNFLQDRGLVSDEAVTIQDCADRDLVRALQFTPPMLQACL